MQRLIREHVQLSHHRQQMRKKEPPCLYITQQHMTAPHNTWLARVTIIHTAYPTVHVATSVNRRGAS